MTIGPEPITSTWFTSLRRGISASPSQAVGPHRVGPRASWGRPCLHATRRGNLYKSGRPRLPCGPTREKALLLSCHQVDELVEQVVRVVWAGSGLRMVLHRKGSPINEFDALDDPVVGAGMADDRGTERGVKRLAGFALEREPVVLGGHRDPSGGVVHDGHVDATVPEHHLVGRPVQRPAEDL